MCSLCISTSSKMLKTVGILLFLTGFVNSLQPIQSDTNSQFIISDDFITPETPEATTAPPSPQNYTPTWPSIDSRRLPGWFDKAKVGIFLHWGVFSVPSYQSEWIWYWWGQKDKDVMSFMSQNYPPKFTYQDFSRDFTAEFYDPVRWAKLFQKAGAKYMVLTSKHHEGFTLWPSKYSFGWNAMDVGPKRDLLGELAFAVRNSTDIRFGVYHSWFEFFNPLYLEDKRNNYTTSKFVRYKAIPELKELVMNYRPDVIWSDGDWEAEDTYWKSKEFLAWLYNSSPVKDTVVVNDRWGKGTPCKHGGYFSCQDHYNPGKILPYKWENAMTIDKKSWGFRRNAWVNEYYSTQELIIELVTTISCGGNFLINVGPTRDGMIPSLLEERLLQIGQWLQINGEAIYSSVPWTVANDSVTRGVWYTSKPDTKALFAILLEPSWPTDVETIVLGSVNPDKVEIANIQVLGLPGKVLPWSRCDGTKCPLKSIMITLPNIPPSTLNRWAWTFKINYNRINDDSEDDNYVDVYE